MYSHEYSDAEKVSEEGDNGALGDYVLKSQKSASIAREKK